MTSPSPQEIELKLGLPGADPQRIADQLAAVPALAGLAVEVQRLHNLYADTPDQHLRRARAALRLRRLSVGEERPRWIQTFKTAGTASGALSQRSEWEQAVPRGELDAAALRSTPWPDIDTDGTLFPQLATMFKTEATRTLRVVTTDDGSRIEVVLDVGDVQAGDQRVNLCELELELLSGTPDALFDLAEHIAQHLPVLPAVLSKAARGWRLRDGLHDAPRPARPPDLRQGTSAHDGAQAVLSDALAQLLENLDGLVRADAPELVHQACVGWQRWRGALALFKPLLAAHPAPDTASLDPFLHALRAVRDLDVAVQDSLPPWANSCAAEKERDDRTAPWHALAAAAQAERRARRTALLAALRTPATGLALLRLERWLHALGQASR